MFAVALPAQISHLIITQAYGGGGGGSTTPGTYLYNSDYVEIYNPTTQPILLSGYSIQYGSATAGPTITYSTAIALPGVSLNPGQYYLVAGIATQGPALPVTPDLTSSGISLSATAGHLAIVSGTAKVLCNATAVVDEFAYGTQTNAACANGTPTAALTNLSGAYRTNVCEASEAANSADFTVSGSVMPHNQMSNMVFCQNNTPANQISAISASGFPTSTAPGVSHNVSVTITDANGNPTPYNGNVTLSSSDANSTLPAPFAYTGAQTSAPVTLYTPGTQSITASIGGGLSGTESNITVTGPTSTTITWIVNSNGTVSRVNANGTPLLTTSNSSAVASLGAIITDSSGNAYSLTNTTNSITMTTPTGTVTTSAGTVNTPTALALDGNNVI